MPSFISNAFSEPVQLVASDDPKEPAMEPNKQRLSNEKSSVRSANSVATGSSHLPNGTADNGRSTKSGKNVVSGGPYIINEPLNSMPNGKSSTTSFHSAFQESGLGSAGPSAQVKPAETHSVRTGPPSSSALSMPNRKPVESAALGSTEFLPPARAPPPIPSSTVQTRHRRAQSASNPSSPHLIPGQDVARLEANRLSSPPNVYDSSNYSSSTSGPSSLHPGSMRLQHRHTLEVPKLSTARGSRDLPPSRESEDGPQSANSPSTGVRRGSLNLMRRATRSMQSDMFLEDAPPDSDTARWQDSVRQKRASRRRRKEEEEDDKVMVGKKVDENHVNWITAYDMLTGIRYTVSRTNAKMDRDLTEEDFHATHKFSFDVAGNELTPSAKYDFKFKDYAPWVFRRLRTMFRLDPADYLVSLTAKVILSELGSPGKSGSFFYFSRDYKYIIKTIHHAEHKLLRKVLKDYYAHIEENPNTLISQFYGLHRIKIPYGRKIHFVVMNNLFPPHRDIHQTFDLKGSTIGRDFKEEELEKNPRATLKDLNWLRRNYHLELGPIKKRMFIEQMTRDVTLLKKLKIMDYSLLVGIHDISKGNDEGLRDKTLQVFQPEGEVTDEPYPRLNRTPSKIENAKKARELRQALHRERPVPIDKSNFQMPDLEARKTQLYFYADDGGFQASHENNDTGEEIYYLGIIDCLTHYGFVKRLEHFWKGMQNNKTQISPIPPEGYGDRFVNFISGVTMPREEAEKQPNSLDGTGSGHRPSHPSQPRTSSERVVEKAEKQAQKTERHGAHEEDTPERRLVAARSPSMEHTGAGGITLPILEEVGESGSTGGRSIGGRSGNSNHSRSREPSEAGNLPMPTRDAPPLGGRPPPTPPKDSPPAVREQHRDRLGAKELPSLPNPRFSGSPITFLPEGGS